MNNKPLTDMERIEAVLDAFHRNYDPDGVATFPRALEAALSVLEAATNGSFVIYSSLSALSNIADILEGKDAK